MFKRVLSLCVALVFVAGASGGLFAQGVEDIRIEVVSPDSGTVIKIGDVIEVNVYATKGLVDTVHVALGDIDVTVDTGTFGDIIGSPFEPTSSWADSISPTRAKAGESIDTFKGKITVGKETIERLEEMEEVEVHVGFAKGDDNDPPQYDFEYTSNASDMDSSVPPGGEKVGDKVKFHLDLMRPEALFVGGVKLEGGKGADFPADSTLVITTLRGTGDVVSDEDNAVVLMIPAKEIDTRVEGANALNATGTPGSYTDIAESTLKVFQDSALQKIELGRADVLASLSNKDFSADDFEGDNVKFYLLAFTADDAGNLSDDGYFTSILAKARDDEGGSPRTSRTSGYIPHPVYCR